MTRPFAILFRERSEVSAVIELPVPAVVLYNRRNDLFTAAIVVLDLESNFVFYHSYTVPPPTNGRKHEKAPGPQAGGYWLGFGFSPEVWSLR